MAGRALEVTVRALTALGALAIAVMMVATCWDIVSRQVANAPLHGVVELVEVMVLASAMLGLPEAFLRDQQISVDLIDGFVPPRVLVILKTIAIILAIVLLAILAFNVVQPLRDAYRFGDVKYDIGVPLYPLYGLIVFSFAASILACVATLARGPAGRGA